MFHNNYVVAFSLVKPDAVFGLHLMTICGVIIEKLCNMYTSYRRPTYAVMLLHCSSELCTSVAHFRLQEGSGLWRHRVFVSLNFVV